MRTIESVLTALNSESVTFEYHITLSLPGLDVEIRCNNSDVLSGLENYFSGYMALNYKNSKSCSVFVVEAVPSDVDFPWVDWPREAGKSGRKDTYYDQAGDRWLRKVKTGMVFFQSLEFGVAFGPCSENLNQVINFVNNQLLNCHQQLGASLCHASAISINGRGVAIAAFSGGGKSTSLLRLMNATNGQFISNDRLLIYSEDVGVKAVGIPKLPRINPGTIVHNSKLHSIISESDRERYLSMPADDLWDLEEKYDVDVEAVYGNGRLGLEMSLDDVLLLNWNRRDDRPVSINRVNLAQRRELLPAITKSPGPFYQDSSGQFLDGKIAVEQQPYIDVLSGVNVYEVSGGVDFDELVRLYLDQVKADC